MARNRYKDTGKGTFMGDYLYAAYVERHQDHFLVALQELFDWESYSDRLLQCYKGRGTTGRPPYDPVLIFKMLLISYLYNVSEREVERLADDHMMVRWFLGIAIDRQPPDHSTLTAFKRRYLGEKGWQTLQSIFDDLIGEAIEHGLEMGEIQVLDSVHTQADVNNEKDRDRHKKGRSPRDPDARVVNKGKRSVVEADGTETTKQIRYCGYKTHASVNAETGIVTTVVPDYGNTADNKAFPAVREHDRSLDLPTSIYAGDKAYDDTDIYSRLEEEALNLGITLNDFRTKKKDANKGRWLELIEKETYQRGVKNRYRVEQPFGLAKAWHGFERCRYLGLARYRIQSLFTFMVCNSKRIIKLLTGVTFRTLAKGRRAEKFTPVYASLPWGRVLR